jgi:hypothetical protein
MPAESGEGPVVVDNTVLSNLALVGRPDLIEQPWGEKAVSTAEVLAEYGAGARAGHVPGGAYDDLAIVALTPEEVAFASSFPPRASEAAPGS